MKNKIPQSFIQDVVSRTDIVALIGARIDLKRRGDNGTACCPFHNEKSPSFSVSQSKQFYYCFGCGAHGNAVSFLMAYDRLPFVEAVTTLAEQLGMTVPVEAYQGPSEDHSLLFDVLLHSRKCFQKKLSASKQAINYLKTRGLTGEVARDFAIGYAPDDWSFLCDALGEKAEHMKALQTTGMIIEKSQTRHYDRFRDRIMFPIRDIRGRTIAFGGRILTDGTPKYLNSPETPVFNKSKTLYGLYEAYQQQRQLNKVIVVEGYMDVISLAQHGIHYAVATLGTALNAQHVQLLSRYTSDIIFCFDGDNAGKKAAWKALTISLPMLRDGFNIRFLFLSNGEDPDTLIQKIGHDAFEQYVESALALPDVFFTELEKLHPTTSIAGKAAFAKSAVNYLKNMPEGIFKNLLFDQLANTLDIARNELMTLANQQREQQPKQTMQDIPTEKVEATFHLPSPKKRLTPTQSAIQLLLHDPKLIKAIKSTALLKQQRQSAEVRLLLDLIERITKNPGIAMGALLTQYKEETQSYLVKISTHPIVIPKAGMEQELNDALLRIQAQYQQQQLAALIAKAKHTALSHEEKQLLQLLLTNKH